MTGRESKTVAAIVQIVASGVQVLAEVAPAVAEVFTGGRPVQELADEALRRARALPVRSGAAGTDEADLEQRLDRVRRSRGA